MYKNIIPFRASQIYLNIYNFSFRKLLKEHESKYEPLGHEESTKIMEEILAMQIGFSADQVRS